MGQTKVHSSQQNAVAFSAYRNGSTQSLPSVTFTKVLFDTEVFDSNSNFDTSNGRFTPTVAGYYNLNAGVNLTSVSDQAVVHVALMKNGGNIQWSRYKQSGSGEFAGYVSTVVEANGTTDYFEVSAYTTSAATTITISVQNTWFNGSRV